MLLRGALIGALLSWVAARATTAAGQLFLPVPLLGYFRADAGLLLVALACTAAALLPWWRLLPATCVGLAGPMALFAVGLDPPRFRHGGDKPVQVLNGSTAYFVSVAGALSPAECAALVRAVWDVRPSWTHASHAGALAYFHFPWSANFDKGDDPAEAPLWSFSYGLRFLMGHESHHATHPQGAERRAAVAREAKRLFPLFAPLRRALAAHFNTTADRVIFGGDDGGWERLGAPSVQVYLPNMLWHTVHNRHTDAVYVRHLRRYLGGQRFDELRCSAATATSFLLPLVAPAGAGLLYYDAPRGQISENEHRYTVGTLHAFAVWTPHSIRPWPYREWAAGEARVTVQTFGIRCGEWWVMYH